MSKQFLLTKGWTLASVQLLFVLLFSFSASLVYAAKTIDSFNQATNCNSTLAFPSCIASNGEVTLNPGASFYRHPERGVGGERDYTCQAHPDNAEDIRCFIGSADLNLNITFPGEAVLRVYGVEDKGSYWFKWDGVQSSTVHNGSPPFTNHLGMSEDLLEGGSNNVFRLRLTSNPSYTDAATVRIFVYKDMDNYSFYSVPAPNTSNFGGVNYRNWDIYFSEFEHVGTGADFTNVKAIELLLDAYDDITLGVDHFSVDSDIQGSLSYSLVDDRNNDGDVDSGTMEGENDTVEYTVVLTNVNDLSNLPVGGVIYSAEVNEKGTLVIGSVTTTKGTVISGNGASDEHIEIAVGTLNNAQAVEIRYRVKMLPGHNGSTFSHQGRLLTNTGLDTVVGPLSFNLNAFGIVVSMVAEPSPVNGDIDGDGVSGPGERVRFTATITNNGSSGRTLTFWQMPIEHASLVVGSVVRNPGTGISSGNSSGDQYVRVNRDASSLAVGSSMTVRFDLLIAPDFPFMDFNDLAAYIAAQSVATERLVGTTQTLEVAMNWVQNSTFKAWSDDPTTDQKGDATRMFVDAFPDNFYAALDADNDGFPDQWNAGTCDEELPVEDVNSCESLSGLVLDPYLNDSDNDGVPNDEDAFPNNPYASVDTDGDGQPDFWNEGSCDNSLPPEHEESCESLSGLTLDPAPNNPNPDFTAPVVTAPVDIKVTATGEKTTVSLGKATAIDDVDGALTATPSTKGPFKVGKHLVIWSATDAAGNVGTAIQKVTVIKPKEVKEEPKSSSGGGGSFAWFYLSGLLLLALRRYRIGRLVG